MGLDTIIFYTLAVALSVVSLIKNKEKTKKAFIKAWKAFENILPQIIGIMILLGMLLTFVNAATMSLIVGKESGWLGVAIASVVGAITLIPGFVAFPTAALLLSGGAGYMQVGAFVSSLMMVGVVTLPVEIKYLRKKTALLRNGLSFIFAFVAALAIGIVMGG